MWQKLQGRESFDTWIVRGEAIGWSGACPPRYQENPRAAVIRRNTPKYPDTARRIAGFFRFLSNAYSPIGEGSRRPAALHLADQVFGHGIDLFFREPELRHGRVVRVPLPRVADESFQFFRVAAVLRPRYVERRPDDPDVEPVAPGAFGFEHGLPGIRGRLSGRRGLVPGRLLRVFRPGRRRLHGQESDPVLVGVSDRRIVVHEHREKDQDIQGEYPGARPAFPLPGGKGKDQADRQR